MARSIATPGRDGIRRALRILAAAGVRRVMCVWCFADYLPGLEVDHIIPKSRGGKNTADNMQLLCSACNRAKGALTPEEFVALCGESDAARLPGLRRFGATPAADGGVAWADGQEATDG